MKMSIGFVLGSLMVVATAVPAYAATTGPNLPPTTRPCVSTPNSTRRCPKPVHAAVVQPVSFGAR